MTDARLPERYLHDRRFRMAPEHFRAYCMSLMYAVSNRTDGYLTPEDLEAVPHFKAESIDALVTADLWAVVDDGWLISDFLTTQTSRAQLEAAENARFKDAERKARERAAKKTTPAVASSEAWSPADSPADNRSHASNPADNPKDDVGQARTGQDRPSTKAVTTEIASEVRPENIDSAYPTDPKAIEWRKRIDSMGITSEAQLVEVAKVTPNQARRMWQAAFPEVRAA